MATTPDRFPGTREEDEVQFVADTTDPANDGAMRYVSGSFRMKDSIGVFNPRSGSGISEADHKVLRQLIHFADEGPGDGFETAPEAVQDPLNTFQPDSYTWYTDSTHTTRLAREEFTWSGINPATRKVILYDGAGAALSPVLLDTYTFSGIHHQKTVRTFPVS